LGDAVHSRLSEAPDRVASGRKFGLTLGVAFAVLAIVSQWRGHAVARAVFGASAAVLIACALAAPAALRGVERVWMRLAAVISRVTTPLFLAVVYFLVLTPFGVIRRRLGGNALIHRPDRGGFWLDRSQSPRSTLDRQF
jgi:hypothetical protein